MANPYAPARQWHARAGAIVAVASLAAALVGAAAGHAAARIYALLLVLPALQGVAVGLAAQWAIRRARLSHTLGAAAIAAVAAVGALAGHAVLDYAAARAAHVTECDELRALRTSIGVGATDDIDRDYRDCVDRTSLGSFLARRVGSSAGDPTATDRGASFGTSSGAFVIGVIELLLAMLVAGGFAWSAAAEPACEQCGAWRVERALGRAAHSVARAMVDALLRGDAAAAAAELRPPDTNEETRVALLSCPNEHDCGGGVLRVEEQVFDRRRRMTRRVVADLMVDRGEAATIAEAIDG